MKKLSIAIACSMLLLSMTGCGVDEKAQNNTNGMGTQSINEGKSTINSYGNNATNNRQQGNQQQGNHQHGEHQSMLSQHVRNVEGVTDSTILVDDDNIIVGLDVDSKADRAKVEDEVRKILTKDHNGQNIHITSDGTFHERIRTLNNQVNQLDGQPIKNMANDIRTLIDDIGNSVERAIR